MAGEKRERPVFLTDAELADIDQRIAAANRLRATFGLGPEGGSELERLVAEVRHWRSREDKRAKRER